VLSGGADGEDSLGVELLGDIRKVFDASQASEMTTKALIAALRRGAAVAPAARDGLIALWCGLRDAQPTQPSSRAELQQARLALGLRRAQRGQSSASQLATNPRQRLWCHLARARVPDTANRVPVLDSGSQLKKRKDSDSHPPLPTGGAYRFAPDPVSKKNPKSDFSNSSLSRFFSIATTVRG